MFWLYKQINNGGKIIRDHRLAPYVIIEAESIETVDKRAQEVGLYFDYYDPIRDEFDCDCCDPRWDYMKCDIYQHNFLGKKTLIEHLINILLVKNKDYDDTGVVCHVYFLDGKKLSYSVIFGSWTKL